MGRKKGRGGGGGGGGGGGRGRGGFFFPAGVGNAGGFFRSRERARGARVARIKPARERENDATPRESSTPGARCDFVRERARAGSRDARTFGIFSVYKWSRETLVDGTAERIYALGARRWRRETRVRGRSRDVRRSVRAFGIRYSASASRRHVVALRARRQVMLRSPLSLFLALTRITTRNVLSRMRF